MRKKTIMLALYTLSLIVFLLHSMLSFCRYPEETVEAGKTTVTVKWTERLENESYIDSLYALSEEMGDDLMLSILTENYWRQYYRTERNPSFIALEGLDPSQQYSTSPQNGEHKIKGFFFLPESDFQIAPLRLLKDQHLDLSLQSVLVPTDKLRLFSELAAARGLALSTDIATTGAGGSFLRETVFASAFVLLVSVVFYAFSRSKDMIIKKTMGFRDWDIVKAEIRENGLSLLCITGAVLLLAFILLSAVSDASSTLFFLKKNLAEILLYLIGTALLITAFVFFVSTQCSVSHSKGKSFDKQLFAFTLVFKTVIVIFLGVSMTALIRNARQVYSMRQTTKNAASIVEGYAETTMNGRLERPADRPEQYETILFSFYRRMHDEHNFIVASFPYTDLADDASADSVFSATINDNYLDAFDTIYGTDGKRIDSACLVEGKYNYLIPENFDTAEIVKQYAEEGLASEEDLHFIRYSDSSRFFTFSNRFQDGFLSNTPVVAEVYDPELFRKTYSVIIFDLFLDSIYSQYGFFTYDTASSQSPYEQIKQIIDQTGMDKVLISTPAVQDAFMEDLRAFSSQFFFLLAQFLLVLLSFSILIVYSAELEYKIFAKDYSIKLVNGYGLDDIFLFRILWKLLILPVFVVMPNVSFPVAIFCILSELVCFIICMKKKIGKNTVAVLKGE